MWRFIKKAFAVITTFFNLSYVDYLQCVSMNNQECKARLKIIDVNSNEPVFYPYSIKVSKWVESCGSINIPFAKICIPDITKSINVRVFNLMQRINETRRVIWHETRKFVCRLTSAVCKNKQIWNEGKCRCECKEDSIDKGICDKEFIWSPISYQCECDKSCGIGQYLDYKSCVCRNSLVNKLVEECTNVIDGNKIYNKTLNMTLSNDCAFCTLYVVLFAVFLSTNIIIGGAFVYFYWYKKNQKDN